MGCVQCKDKEATKLTEERDGSLNQSSGYRYGTDPTPQHYPSFGVTSIPNYNNFHAAGGQGLTVFGGVNSSSHTGTLRTRGGTGKSQALLILPATRHGASGSSPWWGSEFSPLPACPRPSGGCRDPGLARSRDTGCSGLGPRSSCCERPLGS